MKAGVYEVTLKLTKPGTFSPMSYRVIVDDKGNATWDLKKWISCQSPKEEICERPRIWECGFHNCRILPWIELKKPLDNQEV